MMMHRTRRRSLTDIIIQELDDDETEGEVSYYDARRNWKNCIFLQFKLFWRVFLCFGILVNIVAVLYFLIFIKHEKTWIFLFPFYVFEMFYFVDVCLAIMHRCMKVHRSSRLHKSRNLLLLTIDIISILPYYEIYCILLRTSIGPSYSPGADYFKLKVLLRLQYVGYLYFILRNQPTGNQLVVVVLGQMYFFIVFVMIMASVWYTLKDVLAKSWELNLGNYHFDNKNPVHWLIICINIIGCCFMHNWAGNIANESIYDYLAQNITMMVGYLLHMMIFFGDLTAQYIRMFKQQIGFSSRLNIIVGTLNDWKINAPTIKRTIDHYNKFWEVRRSMITIPTIFKVLPLALQKEVTLDMFWESLDHSHFFKDADFNFKRSLCLGMQPEIYLPGDVLVQRGRLKTKMFYVSAGVIQVLTQNENSPMISFSSGTIIGEICSLLPLQSPVTIRCQTYCEISSLDFRNLSRTIAQYKKSALSLRKCMKRRIAHARLLQDPKLLKIRSRQGITTLHWFKLHWDLILQNTKMRKHKDFMAYMQNPAHTSRYLDLYVLSDDVELKVDVICLTSHFPCILDENSSFRKFSFYLVLIAATIQCILVPYLVFFAKEFSIASSGALYILDIFYIYGLYIELTTAIRKDQRVITGCKKIVLHKLKKVSTMLDIVSSFPIELFAAMVKTNSELMPKLHLNRVLKVQRLFTAMQLAERNLWLNPLRLKLFRYCLITVYLIYLASAILYAAACPLDCLRYGWYKYNSFLEEQQYNIIIPEKYQPSPFLSSLSYAVSIFMSLTDSMYISYVALEMACEVVVSFIGYWVHSFTFSELAACAVVQMMQNTNYLEYLTRIRYFIGLYEIPSDIKKMIYSFTQCHWDYSQRLELAGSRGFLNDAPENIKNSVLYARIIDTLNKSVLFKYITEEVLWNIAPTIRLHIAPPGTVLCRELSHASHIQIILRGYARGESTIPTDEYHGLSTILKPHDVFPLLGLTLGVRTFIKITAITYVEVAVIPYNKILAQLKNTNMMLYKHYIRSLEDHRKSYDMILMRRKGRLPEMVSSKKSYGKGEYFVYETNEKFDDSPIDLNVMGPYLKLGKWKCIRYFFLPQSISPTNKFYTIWESIRCTIIGLNVLYVFFLYKYCNAIKVSQYFELFYFTIFIIDTYLRMHCHYYNKNGILITHPLSTSLHYLTHAFALDLYTNVPFTIVKLNQLFHRDIEAYVSHFLMLCTRPWGIYRIYCGISYIEERSFEVKSQMMNRLKHIIVVLVILGVLSCILEHSTCRFDKFGNYACANNSWIAHSDFGKDASHTNMIVAAFYQIVTMFSCSSSGLFIMRTYGELIIYNFFVASLVGLRWYILLKIIALSIKGNVKLVEYQHNVNVMIKFMRDKLLTDTIIKEVTDHYENLYTKTQGCDANEILSTFFPMMTREIGNYMYRNMLSSAQLFADADAADIRFLTSLCKEVHFKKDADIIRCNQVQNDIYIVYKGLVKISVADMKLKILESGGMFGCFNKTKIRQTITATALVHVELLVMNGKILCEILQKYPQIKTNLKTIQMMNVEFITSVKKATKKSLKKFVISRPDDKTNMKKGKMDKFMINPSSKWFGWYEYLLMMHFAPLSSIFTIAWIIIQDLKLRQILTLYFIDFIFLSKMVFSFFLTYTDHETGLRVKSFRLIIKRYFLKFDGFATDLITCAPIDIVASAFGSAYITPYYKQFYMLNRSLKFIHMINYYNICKNKLTVSKSLKWTFLVYVLSLLIHFMSCIWFVIACPSRVCPIITIDQNEQQILSVDVGLNFRVTYQYVISTFTSTGIRDQTPSTVTELLVTVVMVFIFQILMIALQSEFATLLSVGKYTGNRFGEMAENLRIYLQSTHVSISLIDKVSVYLLQLWVGYSGHCIPVLITQAPYYLRQDIMFQLYGNHLLNHVLFAKTHIDFIKQLVTHMKLEVYLPGQYIIQKGDVDNTMYFIVDGEVRVWKRLIGRKEHQKVLKAGASFGVKQGFLKEAHVKSVETVVSSNILCLNTNDWEYLMESFPASKETLFDGIKQLLN
ncbi:uncharacterized protein [Onthophagus taurus]|uniref:uncharacterized protein isoform X2 n=1 Tax=Onthophagus taurus TaxID=166361 RepID=UPI0039BE77B0